MGNRANSEHIIIILHVEECILLHFRLLLKCNICLSVYLFCLSVSVSVSLSDIVYMEIPEQVAEIELRSHRLSSKCFLPFHCLPGLSLTEKYDFFSKYLVTYYM